MSYLREETIGCGYAEVLLQLYSVICLESAVVNSPSWVSYCVNSTNEATDVSDEENHMNLFHKELHRLLEVVSKTTSSANSLLSLEKIEHNASLSDGCIYWHVTNICRAATNLYQEVVTQGNGLLEITKIDIDEKKAPSMPKTNKTNSQEWRTSNATTTDDLVNAAVKRLETHKQQEITQDSSCFQRVLDWGAQCKRCIEEVKIKIYSSSSCKELTSSCTNKSWNGIMAWLGLLYCKFMLFCTGDHLLSLQYAKKVLGLLYSVEKQEEEDYNRDIEHGVNYNSKQYNYDCIMVKVELLLLIATIHEQTGDIPHSMSYLVEAGQIARNCRDIGKHTNINNNFNFAYINLNILVSVYSMRLWVRMELFNRLSDSLSLIYGACKLILMETSKVPVGNRRKVGRKGAQSVPRKRNNEGKVDILLSNDIFCGFLSTLPYLQWYIATLNNVVDSDNSMVLVRNHLKSMEVVAAEVRKSHPHVMMTNLTPGEQCEHCEYCHSLSFNIDCMWDSIGRIVNSSCTSLPSEGLSTLPLFDTCVNTLSRAEILLEYYRHIVQKGCVDVQHSEVGAIQYTRSFDVVRFLRRRLAVDNISNIHIESEEHQLDTSLRSFVLNASSCYTSLESIIDTSILSHHPNTNTTGVKIDKLSECIQLVNEATCLTTHIGPYRNNKGSDVSTKALSDIQTRLLSLRINPQEHRSTVPTNSIHAGMKGADGLHNGMFVCSMSIDWTSGMLIISRMDCTQNDPTVGRFVLPTCMSVGIPIATSFRTLLDQWKGIMENNHSELLETRNITVIEKWTDKEKRGWWDKRYNTDSAIKEFLISFQDHLGVWTCLFDKYIHAAGTSSSSSPTSTTKETNDNDEYISAFVSSLSKDDLDTISSSLSGNIKAFSTGNTGKHGRNDLVSGFIGYIFPWLHVLLYNKTTLEEKNNSSRASPTSFTGTPCSSPVQVDHRSIVGALVNTMRSGCMCNNQLEDLVAVATVLVDAYKGFLQHRYASDLKDGDGSEEALMSSPVGIDTQSLMMGNLEDDEEEEEEEEVGEDGHAFIPTTKKCRKQILFEDDEDDEESISPTVDHHEKQQPTPQSPQSSVQSTGPEIHSTTEHTDEEQAIEQEIPVSCPDFDSMKVTELKEQCKKYNVSSAGRKLDLIGRLKEAFLTSSNTDTIASKSNKLKSTSNQIGNFTLGGATSSMGNNGSTAVVLSTSTRTTASSPPHRASITFGNATDSSIVIPPCSTLKTPCKKTLSTTSMMSSATLITTTTAMKFKTPMKTSTKPSMGTVGKGATGRKTGTKGTGHTLSMKTPAKNINSVFKIFHEDEEDDEVNLSCYKKRDTGVKARAIPTTGKKSSHHSRHISASTATTHSSKVTITTSKGITTSDATQHNVANEDVHSNQPHIVFILDETLQKIPIECLPCLLGSNSSVFSCTSSSKRQGGVSKPLPPPPSSSSSRSCSRIPGLVSLLLTVDTLYPTTSDTSKDISTSSLGNDMNNLKLNSTDNKKRREKHSSTSDHDQHQQQHRGKDDKENVGNVHRHTSVALKNSWYVIDPEHNLCGTSAVMSKLLLPYATKYGWDGYVGEIPSQSTVKHNHEKTDLFIYCGHGWGNCLMKDYSGVLSLRKYSSCPAALLWGCSSGALTSLGVVHDPTGVVLAYLQRGSPFIIGNLWDVTERDIDTLSEYYMKQMLVLEDNKQANKPSKYADINLGTLLNTSRETCKLKLAVGCASVIYGIPVDIE